MKNWTFLLATVLLLWIPCQSQGASPAQQENGERETASQKDRYQDKTEARLQQLKRRIADLNAKAAPQAKAARKELDRQIAQLDERCAVLQQRLDKLKNTSQEAWRDAKPDIDAAMKNLEAAYQRAAADFNRSH